MLLANLLDPKTIHIEPRVLGREQVYQDIIDRICQQKHYASPLCGKPLLPAIADREKESSMAYPSGIAIPHVRIEGLEDTIIGITFLQNPIDYEGVEVNWVALIFTDKSSSKLYLNVVSALLKLSLDSEAMTQLRSQSDGYGVVNYLRKSNIEVGKDICIADIMVVDPICVSPDAPLSVLDSLMNEHKISMIPVVNDHKHYLGEVNILDVLKVGVPHYVMMIDDLAFLRSYEPLESLFEQEDRILVREVMRRDAKTLSPGASIIEAVYYMIQKRQRYFCVVEGKTLVGVLTAMDVFRKVIKA
ncbi:MAG: PTS sugar transporter subunit IIA [Candidatus Syntrophosphaera sp.]|nr:PTS sugar transporter subunit IIA [Candidatus Syntrophosphaera sp.]